MRAYATDAYHDDERILELLERILSKHEEDAIELFLQEAYGTEDQWVRWASIFMIWVQGLNLQELLISFINFFVSWRCECCGSGGGGDCCGYAGFFTSAFLTEEARLEKWCG